MWPTSWISRWIQFRAKPYEWTLLHAAAQNGHLPVVDLLLKRGLDVNTRETGDNTARCTGPRMAMRNDSA